MVKETQQTPGPWLRPIKNTTQENRWRWREGVEGLQLTGQTWHDSRRGKLWACSACVCLRVCLCVREQCLFPPPVLRLWPWPPASNSHSLITEICVPAKGIVGVSIVWGPVRAVAIHPRVPSIYWGGTTFTTNLFWRGATCLNETSESGPLNDTVQQCVAGLN